MRLSGSRGAARGIPQSGADLADMIVAAATAPLSNERVREMTGLDRRQALGILRWLVAEGG